MHTARIYPPNTQLIQHTISKHNQTIKSCRRMWARCCIENPFIPWQKVTLHSVKMCDIDRNRIKNDFPFYQYFLLSLSLLYNPPWTNNERNKKKCHNSLSHTHAGSQSWNADGSTYTQWMLAHSTGSIWVSLPSSSSSSPSSVRINIRVCIYFVYIRITI